MQKFSSTNIIASIKQLTLMRLQDGLLPFVEKPSDKYEAKCNSYDEANSRINALDLFSLFTADIIKEKVLFIR